MKVSYNNPHPSFWYGYVFNSQKWFYYQKYVNQINFNDLLFQVFVIIHLILNPSLKILKTLKTLKILTYVFDWLYFILCLTFFSSVDPPLLSGQFFDTASSTIAEILSIGPSANMLAVGDFGVHCKNWLAFSGGTDTTGELCYNFSISNGLTQIVKFPNVIPDRNLLLFFILQCIFLLWDISKMSHFPTTFFQTQCSFSSHSF